MDFLWDNIRIFSVVPLVLFLLSFVVLFILAITTKNRIEKSIGIVVLDLYVSLNWSSKMYHKSKFNLCPGEVLLLPLANYYVCTGAEISAKKRAQP